MKMTVNDQILAICRRLGKEKGGTWGMRSLPENPIGNTPIGKAVANGYRVAVMRLDTWGDAFDDQGEPVAGVTYAAAKTWDDLLAALPRKAYIG